MGIAFTFASVRINLILFNEKVDKIFKKIQIE